MTLTEQFTSPIDQMVAERDGATIVYVSATVDGTERHAVRRTTWASGNTSGNRTECGRNARPGSLAETPVTCKQCLRYGR